MKPVCAYYFNPDLFASLCLILLGIISWIRWKGSLRIKNCHFKYSGLKVALMSAYDKFSI